MLPPALALSLVWAQILNADIISFILKWDGEKTLNGDIEAVSLFTAHVKGIMIKKQYMDFLFDMSCAVDNLVSMYLMSILFWGSPLPVFKLNVSENSKISCSSSKEQDEKRKKRYLLLCKRFFIYLIILINQSIY